MKNNNVSRTLEQWIKKLKCSGSSGIGLETFSDIRVGVDPAPVSDDALQFPDPVTSEKVTQCLGVVTTTHGEDMVTLELSNQLSLVTSLRGHDLWSAVSLIRPVDIHCTRDQCPELKSILRDHGIQFSVEVEDLASIAGLYPMKPSAVNVSK